MGNIGSVPILSPAFGGGKTIGLVGFTTGLFVRTALLLVVGGPIANSIYLSNSTPLLDNISPSRD